MPTLECSLRLLVEPHLAGEAIAQRLPQRLAMSRAACRWQAFHPEIEHVLAQPPHLCSIGSSSRAQALTASTNGTSRTIEQGTLCPLP